MLHSIEVVPRSRALVRRGIQLGCELTTNLHGPRRETLLDLSPRGARIATSLELGPGDEVLVALAAQWLGRVETLARVAHVERDGAPSIGVQFVDLDREAARCLAHRLRNVPPPLPRGPRAASAPSHREIVWVDSLLSWEEELDEQHNSWTELRTIALELEPELGARPLGPVLTGGPRAGCA